MFFFFEKRLNNKFKIIPSWFCNAVLFRNEHTEKCCLFARKRVDYIQGLKCSSFSLIYGRVINK